MKLQFLLAFCVECLRVPAAWLVSPQRSSESQGHVVDVLEAVDPLNRFVCDLHGPTPSIAHTMRRLIPFPEEIASLPDADLLDLRVAVNTAGVPGRQVKARARYATSARVGQIIDFYLDEFNAAGVQASWPTEATRDGWTRLQAQLTSTYSPTYRVVVNNSDGYRSVWVSAHYDGFDHSDVIERFASWHRGNAPVDPSRTATGIEIATYASGRRPNTLVLYSTHYACTATSQDESRAMVDARLRELGLTYREPRTGIMFIKGGSYDAEALIFGDDKQSRITYVGEFQLR